MFLIRFVFYFTLSFAILCIPVGNGNQLFDKLYQIITPYADKAATSTLHKISVTKRYTKKLYSNSKPLENDEVKTLLAGVKKKIEIKNNQPDDAYTDAEKERLKKVLNEE